jgi:hypothetical protein
MPRQILNSEHAVSGEIQGQERSTIVKRLAYRRLVKAKVRARIAFSSLLVSNLIPAIASFPSHYYQQPVSEA